MNLANVIRQMGQPLEEAKPPFTPDKMDFASAAKKVREYAKKSGGIDRNDMLRIASELDALSKKASPQLLSRTMRNIQDLDTDVRDKIKELMQEDVESLGELIEAMVRGKEVFDKTFANQKQADEFAKKNGGRVRQVGRVFYVFKEANDEDDAPASPDEMSMAKTQLEFIEYAAEEIVEHIESGKRFPEWMQNKLSAAHEAIEGLHSSLGDHGEDDEDEMNEAYKTPAEAGAYEAGKKAARFGKKYDDNPNKKGTAEFTAWSKGHNEARAKGMNEAKSSTGYDLYHRDFSSAMSHAYKHAKEKLGVEIDPKEIDDKVASGPRKPSAGKTNTYRLKGKDGKKAVQIQVYGMDNGKYELNMYKESVELDEMRQPFVVVDTADGNKVVAMASDEKGAKSSIASAERPPMSIKDKSTLKIVKTSKKQSIGMPLKEEVELDEAQRLFMFKTKAEADKKAKEVNGKVVSLTKQNFAVVVEEVEMDMNEEEKRYQVDIEGGGRETVMARTSKEAIDKVTRKMGIRAHGKRNKMTVKVVEDVDVNELFDEMLSEEVVVPQQKEVGMYGLSKSLLDAVRNVVLGEAKKDDSDDEDKKLDPVNKKALKKDFKNRDDKDIDNDGDVDDSDEFLHKRRQAVSKAVKKDKNDEDDGTEPKEPVGKSGKQMKVDTKPSLDEAEMSDAEMKKREEIVKSMKDKEQYFKDKYGDRAKEVMYATATKMAKKQA